MNRKVRCPVKVIALYCQVLTHRLDQAFIKEANPLRTDVELNTLLQLISSEIYPEHVLK